jgi:exodeoxyribonuclease V alpha subunit
MSGPVQLTPIDLHFAEFMASLAGESAAVVRRAAALVSNAVANGHVCLDLAEAADLTFPEGFPGASSPQLPERWAEELLKSAVVGRPGDYRPLILDESGRLYLHRYWRYERDLAEAILERASSPDIRLDRELLRDGLARLFTPSRGAGTDWQKVAGVAALSRRFTVISGGPGTGKTSTVVRIIALLLEQAGDAPFRVALAAPTGKAAARLRESVRKAREALDCSREIKGRIPDGVSTLHRLLGPLKGSTRFRHDADHPLPYDAVVVDEASMVALPLMAKLVAALLPGARLILLGDRDQLASVEAGAVLGDICDTGRSHAFTPDFSALVAGVSDESVEPHADDAPLPNLADSLVILRRNYRFGDDSPIAGISECVNQGEGERALREMDGDTVGWRTLPRPEGLAMELAEAVMEGYGEYLREMRPEEALRRFDGFRILCALRRGPYGALAVNSLVEKVLAQRGLIDPASRWYRGRPVMVTTNDYDLRLFNGDIGIVLPDPESDGNPRVFFPSEEGGIRKIPPARLPSHETVYAMTVHKSQGSEFGRVLFLLPDRETEILTRELVYTAMTRASARVDILGDAEVFKGAVSRRIRRNSGLRERLWRAR